MKKKSYNLPFIALRGINVVPGMVINFDVSRRKSVRAIEEVMSNPEEEQKIFVVAQRDMLVSEPRLKDMYDIGTIAAVKQVIKLPNSIIRVAVEGEQRAKIGELMERGDILYARADVIEEDDAVPPKLVEKAMCRNLHELLKLYAAANTGINRDAIKQLLEINDIKKLVNKFMSDFPMDYTDRQKLLEITPLQTRFEEEERILAEETEILRIKDDISQKVSQRVEKNQRDYVMREQLKVLHEELDGEDAGSEIDEYYAAVEKLQASDEVKERINKEIRRYKTLASGSSEANVSRGYIETVLSLPWDRCSDDNNDIARAEKILNEDHYGLEKVKERILEFLALKAFTNGAESPIICLVGPPGTGKTSIAKSVARALNREYVRICLGGVRDEAEIRGHRKTYVGAMPGRIIEGLRDAGTGNPLMLLDEIDKVSNDYRSDTSSALLEVLDREQNRNFRDHYIELPVDLSKVLFIATANDVSEMQRPLLDRMEIIEINSYTSNEKLHIAKDYLVPKQLKKAGLKKSSIKFTDKALLTIMDSYVKEAGVRGLERNIAHICRKAVTEFLTDNPDAADNRDIKFRPVKVSERNIEHYLGKKKYLPEDSYEGRRVGTVRGLAWTSVGGDTLTIEVITMPGKGNLVLTGQMGDIMQESAKIAMSHVRAVAGTKYNIDSEYFENTDFHLHIPEGAVPKDGPSAGITMATALLSAVTGKKVRKNLAMTGEITLMGYVLAVGGLKEKLLAAKTAGVKTVLVPARNKADIAELSDEITGGMDIVYVSEFEQVIKNAFEEKN